MNERPTHIDLFSGIGGFSLAFEAEGFETIGFSEIDPYASAVLKKHWPNVPNYGDIRNVPAIKCDIITGGFPCQPFSVAGKRRGASDDRALWPEMLRVIERCRPAYLLGENVPGIINMELDRVLSDLESLNYTARTFVVPACAVDARHRRDRVWIVGNADRRNGEQPQGRRGIRMDGQILEKTKRRQMPNPPQGSGQNVADASLSGSQGQPRNGTASAAPGRKFPWGFASRGAQEAGRIWPTEPGLGRVADGIPNRSQRLKCLGNSIVPQVAQIFAKAIYQQLTTT